MVPPASDRAPPTPPYSGYRLGWPRFGVRGCHPLRPAFPGVFRYPRFVHDACPTTPRAPRRPRFGLFPFRSPLLGESLLFSFPPTTGMFRFVGFASTIRGCRACARRVAPFGHLRITGRLRLPAVFRGLPRPSSPPGAKASSVRLCSLLARPSSLTRDGRLSCVIVVFYFIATFYTVSAFPSCQRTVRGLAPLLWRMWGSNPRPPACKAGALAN